MSDDDETLSGKTTAFSVATLRDLVAKTVEERPSGVASRETETSHEKSGVVDRLPAPEPAPRDARPDVLSKGAPILVFPSRPSVIVEDLPAPEPSVPEPARPPAAPIEPVGPPAAPMEPVGRPAAPIALPLPPARRRARDAVRRSARAAARKGALKLRLFALGVLVLVVYARPWWWNVGDLRSHVERLSPKQ
jgi:hypothetical protein